METYVLQLCRQNHKQKYNLYWLVVSFFYALQFWDFLTYLYDLLNVEYLFFSLSEQHLSFVWFLWNDFFRSIGFL